VFLHEPRVGVVVPHFKSCDFNALLCLQPLHERFHFVAVGSFRSGEHQQVELLFRHWDSSFRGRVGWMPRLLGGEECRPCNHITITRKPVPSPSCLNGRGEGLHLCAITTGGVSFLLRINALKSNFAMGMYMKTRTERGIREAIRASESKPTTK